jgi:hypothetical protein
MKIKVLFFLFLLSNFSIEAKNFNLVINPIFLDEIKDSLIKNDVYSILNSKSNNNLIEYKIKGANNLVYTEYKSNGWSFYVSFPYKIDKRKVKTVLDIYCPLDKNFFEDIRFFHVKFMKVFDSLSLSSINKEILDKFGGQAVKCKVKSYISKDRFRNYLYFNIENDYKKSQYVLIYNNSQFNQYVLKVD